MNRKKNIIILISVLIISLLIEIYLYHNRYISYSIVLGTIIIILIYYIFTYIYETKDEETIYKTTLKKILRDYDSILIESKIFPSLEGKNIIKITNIEDLVDAQNIIKKPIYYTNIDTNSCSFVLLDSNEACIFILRKNENISSPIDLIIDKYENDKKRKSEIETNFINNLEKAIIKMNNTNLIDENNKNNAKLKEKKFIIYESKEKNN